MEKIKAIQIVRGCLILRFFMSYAGGIQPHFSEMTFPYIGETNEGKDK